MARPQASLRRRLLQQILVPLAILWVCNAALLLALIEGESRDDIDQDLQLTAQLLGTLAGQANDPGPVGSDHGAALTGPRLPMAVSYQVFDDSGHLLLRSADAPAEPLGGAGPGISDSRIGEATWRVLVAPSADHRLLLRVAQPLSHQRDATLDMALSLLLPASLALPLLAVVVGIAVQRATRGVSTVARAVAARPRDDFSPVDCAHLPSEMAPLVDAFNALLQRLARALEGERRFNDSAAHELRTPLAAVRIDAQVGLRMTADPDMREVLGRIVDSAGRCGAALESLMVLARLDSAHAHEQLSECFEPSQVVEQTLADFRHQALTRSIELLSEVDPTPVSGFPQALHVILRNLLDNALRHTPDGGRVRVALSSQAGLLRLEVTDSGCGIAPADRDRVFERFVHLGGDERRGGGLGLFIVRGFTATLGGTVGIDDGDGGRGVRVRVELPLEPVTAAAIVPA